MSRRLQALPHTLFASVALFFVTSQLSAAPSLRVTTWRLDFGPPTYTNVPLGKIAERQVRDAAGTLRGINPDVILLTGVTNRQRCEQLANYLKPENYRVAICSKFKNPVEPEDTRQVAILTRLPVTVARAEDWRSVAGNNARGGFAYAVLSQQTNTYYCYVAQMPGDPAGAAGTGPIVTVQRDQGARALMAHAERLAGQFTNQQTAILLAGDFHSDFDATNSTPVAELLEARGFRSVFQNVAMPGRFTEPPLTPDTWQFFDTVVVRGADFFSVPQIGGSKLARHLPVTCDLAMKLSFRAGPDPIVQVDWTRLGAAISKPYRALPPSVQQAVNWGVPALVVVGLVMWIGRVRRNSRRAAQEAAASRVPAVIGHLASQIEYPRAAGETVYVAESVAVKATGNSPNPAPQAATMESDSLIWQMRAMDAEERARQAQAALRSTAMPVMFRMMRDKVLTMLGAQRAHLIDSQETGTRQVLQLEQRLEQIHAQFQENLRARDRRIAELQEQLAAREQALREVMNARSRNPGKQVND